MGEKFGANKQLRILNMEDKFGDFIDYNTMLELNDEITKLLKYMYNNPGKFGVKTND